MEVFACDIKQNDMRVKIL